MQPKGDIVDKTKHHTLLKSAFADPTALGPNRHSAQSIHPRLQHCPRDRDWFNGISLTVIPVSSNELAAGSPMTHHCTTGRAYSVIPGGMKAMAPSLFSWLGAHMMATLQSHARSACQQVVRKPDILHLSQVTRYKAL